MVGLFFFQKSSSIHVPVIFAQHWIPMIARSILTGCLLMLACIILPDRGAAQTPASVRFDPDQGVVIKQDSIFETIFRFRIQDRATFLSQNGSDLHVASAAWQVRRCRLKFEGFAITPRLKYQLQLGLSDFDQAIADGTGDQSILMDAFIRYALSPKLEVGFGETKLPGDRQSIISSGYQEFPERSIATNAFTLDHDFGFHVDWRIATGRQPLRLHAAVSQGEGRSSRSSGDGLCYTGRLEWLPLGAFTKEGDYSEGDLAREKTPKLALATAYSTNIDAQRAFAQRGLRFPDDMTRTINTFFADVLYKYNGWSFSNQFQQRHADDDPVVRDTVSLTQVAVNEGWGATSQLGKMVSKRTEVSVRYSIFKPAESIEENLPRREDAWLGWSYYINGHRIKLQSALIYTWLDGVPDLVHQGDQWGLMFQVEFGI